MTTEAKNESETPVQTETEFNDLADQIEALIEKTHPAYVQGICRGGHLNARHDMAVFLIQLGTGMLID